MYRTIKNTSRDLVLCATLTVAESRGYHVMYVVLYRYYYIPLCYNSSAIELYCYFYCYCYYYSYCYCIF